MNLLEELRNKNVDIYPIKQLVITSEKKMFRNIRY